jgi:hypothetical protein
LNARRVAEPSIVILGGDALALRVCEELAGGGRCRRPGTATRRRTWTTATDTPCARGRVRIGARTFVLEERRGEPPPAAIPLCAWRDGALAFLSRAADLRPGETLLTLAPLDGGTP